MSKYIGMTAWYVSRLMYTRCKPMAGRGDRALVPAVVTIAYRPNWRPFGGPTLIVYGILSPIRIMIPVYYEILMIPVGPVDQ